MARRFHRRVQILAAYCQDSSDSYSYTVLPITEPELREWRQLILDFSMRRCEALARAPLSWPARVLYMPYQDYSPYFVASSGLPACREATNADYEHEWQLEDLETSQSWQHLLDNDSRELVARCDWSELHVRDDGVSWVANEKYCDNKLGTPTLYLSDINQFLQLNWTYD